MSDAVPTVFIDAVVENGGEVLVAGAVEGETLAQEEVPV